MLRHRLISGLVMGGLFIGLLWLDHVTTIEPAGGPLTLLILLLTAKGGHELHRMYGEVGLRPVPLVGIGWAIAIVAGTFLQPLGIPGLDLMSMLVYGFAATLLLQAIFRRTDQAISHVGVTALTAIYLGVLPSFILLIRARFGLAAVLLLVVTVKLTDIGAYFIGKGFGRRKLIPWLSAGKTVEGTAGGIVIGTIAAVLFADFNGIMNVGPALLFGLLIGTAGQLSDLAESLLKRDAARKDSGGSIPGFGGVMDVVDSVLLAAPLAYALLAISHQVSANG